MFNNIVIFIVLIITINSAKAIITIPNVNLGNCIESNQAICSEDSIGTGPIVASQNPETEQCRAYCKDLGINLSNSINVTNPMGGFWHCLATESSSYGLFNNADGVDMIDCDCSMTCVKELIEIIEF